jgi:UDP-N-acetylglucosamine--N-acetylmuramyl-(pentapeptide) pyrophosphoryl-undecaprenol N-acetylglucosamine transferase
MVKPRIIFSGGGTGGHIYPAISIAQKIKSMAPDAQILFVGAEGRMEMEKVPAAGFDIIGLPISGFQRKNIFKNFRLPLLLWKSLRKAGQILDDFKPNVAVGTGGYASGPLLWMAGWKKIPFILQEQNGFPGITNRILAYRAQKICTGYPDMEKYFPAHKIIFTGNPVREDLKNLSEKKEEAYAYFKLNKNEKTILVLGGSLGAKAINEGIKNVYAELKKENIQFIWQTGKNYIQDVRRFIEQTDKKNADYVSDFITRMDLAYAVADLIISRSGASTVSEICLAAKCSILIPSPNVAEDHQTKNAKILSDRKAAVLIHEMNITDDLLPAIKQLLSDDMQRKQIEQNAFLLAKPNASSDIAKIILELVK